MTSAILKTTIGDITLTARGWSNYPMKERRALLDSEMRRNGTTKYEHAIAVENWSLTLNEQRRAHTALRRNAGKV